MSSTPIILAVSFTVVAVVGVGPTAAVALRGAERSAGVHATTLHDLLSAPVPALRGNPAGRLRNGVLPNHIPGGFVGLDRTYDAHPVYGDLTHDGVGDAAAVIDATSGAGGGDQYVEVYTRSARRLAQFDPATATRAEHAQILAVAIRRENVLIDYEVQTFQNRLTYWSARLTWTRGRLAHALFRHTGITGSGMWTDAHLQITPRHLGAVRVGVKIAQAERAVRVFFDGSGDGYLYPTGLPGKHLFVGGTSTSRVRCVGAAGTNAPWQRIVTPRGVAVGDPVGLIKKRYGHAAHFVKAPTGGGLTDYAGYTVTSRRGTLAFFFPARSKTITGIAGGPKGLTPNSCTG
jgi:hypothetical protein